MRALYIYREREGGESERESGLAQAVTLLTCIREVSGSTLGLGTDYSD
jgi:hypothetical protein